MTSLTIHNIDDDMKRSLHLHAQAHGRSIEEEVKDILRQTLMSKPTEIPFGSRLKARFEGCAVNALPLPARSIL
jgi:plasmid stability protein